MVDDWFGGYTTEDVFFGCSEFAIGISIEEYSGTTEVFEEMLKWG